MIFCVKQAPNVLARGNIGTSRMMEPSAVLDVCRCYSPRTYGDLGIASAVGEGRMEGSIMIGLGVYFKPDVNHGLPPECRPGLASSTVDMGSTGSRKMR